MSDSERRSVNIALASFAVVLLVQTVAVVWWAATLQAEVSNQGEALDALSPRVERLEADYWRRGGNGQ
jgi:ABC-type transporter Mla subunit MlaD